MRLNWNIKAALLILAFLANPFQAGGLIGGLLGFVGFQVPNRRNCCQEYNSMLSKRQECTERNKSQQKANNKRNKDAIDALQDQLSDLQLQYESLKQRLQDTIKAKKFNGVRVTGNLIRF